MPTRPPSLALEVEADCPHWLPRALDIEPEMCFCLSCGEALPCATCLLQPSQTQPPKEVMPYV
jgi:hypothetical protein